MKNGGGHFAPKLGGHFELESGGHFKLELGGQYHWNLHTLVQEQNNLVDKYGRHLGYLILNDGRVLNEIMIKEGYAKPYNDVFCEMLPLYQEWNLQAKNSLKGLYSLVNKF